MKNIIIFSFILIFSIFGYCFANENNNEDRKFRHQDDKEFNLEKLKGPLKKGENLNYREKFYTRKNYELLKKQKEQPSGDKVQDLVSQFENFIDFNLGIDFSKEKRLSILKNNKDLQKELNLLLELLEKGEIDEEYCMSTSNLETEKALEEISYVLTDEEFERLFQFSKQKIYEASNGTLSPEE